MTEEINVISRTQTIIVEPTSSAVSIINAGPMGPTGPQGLTGPLDAEALPGQTTSLLEIRDEWGVKRVYAAPMPVTGDVKL